MKETQTCHNVAPLEYFEFSVYVVCPTILFGPSDSSACIKGFASKSRRNRLLAKRKERKRENELRDVVTAQISRFAKY